MADVDGVHHRIPLPGKVTAEFEKEFGGAQHVLAECGELLLAKNENWLSIKSVQDGITVCNRVRATSHCFGLMKRTSGFTDPLPWSSMASIQISSLGTLEGHSRTPAAAC